MSRIKKWLIAAIKCKWSLLRRHIYCFKPIQVSFHKKSIVTVKHGLKFNYNYSLNRILHNVFPGSLNIDMGGGHFLLMILLFILVVRYPLIKAQNYLLVQDL